MHLLNFAHGELITVSGYVTYWCFQAGLSWWLIAPIIVVTAILTSITIEQVAFRWVRGAPDFTLLLTSFGVHFVVEAFFLMYVSASVKTFNRPGWITNTIDIGSITIEVFDLVVIGVTLVVLALTAALLQRTMFGITLRGAAEDFDAARLMGVRSNQVIRGAFALSGALAGIAGIFWLMRAGQVTPAAGVTPMLKGVLAALIGGMGSLRGAVIGGFALGIAEVFLRSWLPERDRRPDRRSRVPADRRALHLPTAGHHHRSPRGACLTWPAPCSATSSPTAPATSPSRRSAR